MRALTWAGRVYAVWLVFTAVMLSLSLYGEIKSGSFDRRIHSRSMYHLDFVSYYAMGSLALSPDRCSIYEPQTQLAWFNSVIYPASRARVLYMEQPPWTFLLVAPISLLPLAAGFITWTVVSVSAAGAGLYLLLRYGRHFDIASTGWFILASAVSFVAWNSYFPGQLGMVLLGIVAIYFWALLAKRPFVAGIALAATSIKLQYLPFLLIPSLVLRERRTIISFMMAQALLCIASAWWFGWQNVVFYPQHILQIETQTSMQFNADAAMVGLHGILAPFIPRAIATYVSFAGMLAALAYTWIIWRNSKDRQHDWPIALTILLALIFNEHSFLYDCSLLAVAAAFTLPAVFPAQLLAAESGGGAETEPLQDAAQDAADSPKGKPEAPPLRDASAVDRSLNFRLWSLILVLYPVTGWFLPVLAKPPHFLSFFVTNVVLLACGILSSREGGNQRRYG